MSAVLSFSVDIDDLKARAVGTQHALALGVRRATQLALDAGAVHARSEHPHTTRTGRLTSPSMLRGELRQADDHGAWGYIINYTPYGAYVEYGTKAHRIWPKATHGLVGPVREGQTRRATGKGPHEHIVGRGLFLRFQVGGRIVFARFVDHPGTHAMPFMQPAGEYAGAVLVRELETVTIPMLAEIWN